MNTDELKKFKTDMEAVLNNLNPALKTFANEQMKLLTPKRMKNMKLDEQDVVDSLIEDGRVIIKFSSLEASEKFYDECDQIVKQKDSFLTKIFKRK